MSSAKHEHCPTRTWRRPQGRGQGILRTRRQATSKDRLAPLSRQRCCWTLRWGWTGGCLFWKLKKLFLQRASTWNSDKAFDSLFFCRFLQDLLRAVHGRAPHISYFKIIQIWAISAIDFFELPVLLDFITSLIVAAWRVMPGKSAPYLCYNMKRPNIKWEMFTFREVFKSRNKTSFSGEVPS